MGDRICIRLTDGRQTTPVFYGHWCGVRALRVMNEAIREPANSIGNIMCNFIVKVMDGRPYGRSYDILNGGESDGLADWDWGLWTFDMGTSTWMTTYSPLRDRSMTICEVEAFVCYELCSRGRLVVIWMSDTV